MPKTQEFNGRVYETRVVVAAGTLSVFTFATAGPAMLRVQAKGSGVSALVEYSTSPSAMLADDTADFDPVPNLANGVIADGTYGDTILIPPTALRITATGGPVIVEILQ